jgi:peptidoglycan/LPS O-acetylase OafA/YrhL
MSTPADLLGLARTRIDACPSRTPDRAEVKGAAAALLADLFTVSLRHGITPVDWAAVAALPTACLDACRLRQERAARLAAPSPRPMTLGTLTYRDSRTLDEPSTTGRVQQRGRGR